MLSDDGVGEEERCQGESDEEVVVVVDQEWAMICC